MTIPAAPEHTPVVPRHSRWLALLVLVVGIGIGAAITAVVVARGDEPASDSSTAQLSQVKAACRDWMGSPDGGAPDGQWCTDMFAWMSEESGGSMMGSMMWQDSDRVGASCRAWIDQDRSESDSTDAKRCDDMVAWMDSHLSDRGGSWMMPQPTD